MPETRGKWTDLIPDVGLKISELFDQGDIEYQPGIFAILRQDSGTGAQKNYTGKTGFGLVSQFVDGDDIGTIQRYKTYTTQVIYTNYGGAVEVTKNTIEDRDFAQELGEMKDLSRAINYSVDQAGFQMFNGGFATTTNVNNYVMTWYGDGVPQYSTVHPTVVPGGSTQSNASATGVVLSHDNLETARIALELQQTDNGKALTMVGKTTLIVPLNLEKTARQTLESAFTPESANNAINIYRGMIDLMCTKFLDQLNGGSNTAWYLINQGVHKLYHDTRQEKRLEMDTNIRNKVVTFTVDARWADHSREWKGTWASKGDTLAYSS
jgi:phage major head subunit gpT-like protein